MTVRSRLAIAAALPVLALAPAACGSSSAASPSSNSRSTASRSGGTSGSIHATFVGANHDPKIRINWPYSIRVSDAHGHPLGGTVVIEFTFAGAVVGRDPSGTHDLRRGRWHDTLNFPAASVGEPLTVLAVIRTPAGSTKLLWPVTPKK